MHITRIVITSIPFITGSIFYLFFFWRRLKEDYQSETIFTSGLILLVISSIAGIGANLLRAGTWFWAALIGFALAFLFIQRKYNLRIFETFEASSVGLFIPFVCLQFFYAITGRNVIAVLHSILLLFCFAIFFFLERRYKRFTWYKSGRVGFSGLSSLGIYFLIRSIIVVFASEGVLFFSGSPFLGKVDALISGIVAFLLFGSIYWLAKQ